MFFGGKMSQMSLVDEERCGEGDGEGDGFVLFLFYFILSCPFWSYFVFQIVPPIKISQVDDNV